MEFYRLGCMKISQNEIYWKLVASCLIEIFGITPTTAKRKSLLFRKEIEELCKSKRVPNLIYHESLVQIASEIIGVKLSRNHINQFQEISENMLNKNIVSIPAKGTNKVSEDLDMKSSIPEKKKVRVTAAKASTQSKVKRAK